MLPLHLLQYLLCGVAKCSRVWVNRQTLYWLWSCKGDVLFGIVSQALQFHSAVKAVRQNSRQTWLRYSRAAHQQQLPNPAGNYCSSGLVQNAPIMLSVMTTLVYGTGCVMTETAGVWPNEFCIQTDSIIEPCMILTWRKSALQRCCISSNSLSVMVDAEKLWKQTRKLAISDVAGLCCHIQAELLWLFICCAGFARVISIFQDSPEDRGH